MKMHVSKKFNYKGQSKRDSFVSILALFWALARMPTRVPVAAESQLEALLSHSEFFLIRVVFSWVS